MFIIDPTLSEEATEKNIKEIEGFITKEKGEIKEIEKIGKRKLLSKIAKKTEGYYLLIYFSLDSQKVSVLNRKCKLNAEILRNMVIKSKTELVTKFLDLNSA